MIKIFSVLALALLGAGCSTVQPIKYSLDDVKPSENKVASVAVKVHLLEDRRKTTKKNEVLFQSTDKASAYQGKTVCMNSEKNYETDKVSAQVTQMIKAHLSKKYPDIKVLNNDSAKADYEMKGEIGEFFAVQEQSVAAMVGQQFGLIGALATMNATTVGEIAISLNNLVINDSSGKVVSEIASIGKNWTGEFHADAYCWAPYWNINDKLKLVIEELVTKVGTEIQRVVAASNTASQSTTVAAAELRH